MRSALIVATNAYRDERLRQLRAPAHDAAALADVLSDDTLGGFDVDVLTDVDETTLRRRVASFFRQRARDDLLLLHFSCHGVKNEHGDLYFAAVDTDLDNLEATALSSSFVNELMSRSLSRRIVLLLDCCYSGAFGRSALARGADGVDLKERFDGRGRVVLTASTSMEYAFEGLDIVGEGTPSVFSAAVADGIRTGVADRDGDGEITVEELYDHVYDTVRVESPSQTPSKWSFDVQGDFLIAKSNAVLDPFRVLPHELTGAVQSPLAHVRESAVTVLSGIMSGYHPTKERRAANSLLELLVQDDSRKVSMAAEAALREAPKVKDDRAAPADPPEPHIPAQLSESTPTVPPPRPPRSVLPDAEPQHAPDRSDRAMARTESKPKRDLNRYGRAAALAGAALLVVTCLVVGDGIFAPSHIDALPLVLPISASFMMGVISLIGLLTLSKDVRWGRTMFFFATTASLILFLQQVGLLYVGSYFGVSRIESISLLIASVLLLVGSLIMLRTDLEKSENAESHFGTRTIVALLTALGGVLLAVSLVIPVTGYGNFFLFHDDYDTFTPLLGGSFWKSFAAYAALALLAIGVSIWLLFWHPESSDIACGILAAIAALASIFAILVLKPDASETSWTFGALVLTLAALGFVVAAVLAFRATRQRDVANDASLTAANASA